MSKKRCKFASKSVIFSFFFHKNPSFGNESFLRKTTKLDAFCGKFGENWLKILFCMHVYFCFIAQLANFIYKNHVEGIIFHAIIEYWAENKKRTMLENYQIDFFLKEDRYLTISGANNVPENSLEPQFSMQ